MNRTMDANVEHKEAWHASLSFPETGGLKAAIDIPLGRQEKEARLQGYEAAWLISLVGFSCVQGRRNRSCRLSADHYHIKLRSRGVNDSPNLMRLHSLS